MTSPQPQPFSSQAGEDRSTIEVELTTNTRPVAEERTALRQTQALVAPSSRLALTREEIRRPADSQPPIQEKYPNSSFKIV